jgi:hypothetical protein
MHVSLESSLPKATSPLSHDNFLIYKVKVKSNVVKGYRILRNYSKTGAALPWSFTSQKFCEKKLNPINPSALWKFIEGKKRAPTVQTAFSIILQIYLTGQCSDRQAMYIENIIAAKSLGLAPIVVSVLKNIENNANSTEASMRALIDKKLNLLNQYKNSEIYEAIASEHKKLINNFVNQTKQ